MSAGLGLKRGVVKNPSADSTAEALTPERENTQVGGRARKLKGEVWWRQLLQQGLDHAPGKIPRTGVDENCG